MHSNPCDECCWVFARGDFGTRQAAGFKRFSRCTISLFAVLAGDAIKSVKPYFGLGVNTAFEDCVELDRCARTRSTRSRKIGTPVALGFRSWNPSLG